MGIGQNQLRTFYNNNSSYVDDINKNVNRHNRNTSLVMTNSQNAAGIIGSIT